MTIPQMFVAYSVCWWLVLFMVLPSGVTPVKNPAPGHVPSAPANPRLKRKFGITTLIAILPTILIYFIATTAKAEETIYHAGSSKCAPLTAYTPSDDLNTRDGHGPGDKKVAPANLEQSTFLDDMKHVDIPLQVPTKNYLDEDKYNADLSESFAQVGKLSVGMDGSTSLNGRPITNQSTLPTECQPKKETK